MEKREIMTGESMLSQQNIDNSPESYVFLEPPTARYLGRMTFGDGNINAEQVQETEFMNQLSYVATNGFVFAPDIRQLYGGCMDGRGNIQTAAGNPVAPRPKIIGGPSLFAWNVASIGGFSILEGIEDPIEQFALVNKKLAETGFRLGMHYECGAARGVSPVLEHFATNFEGINDLIGAKAKTYSEFDGGVLLDGIYKGISNTLMSLGNSSKEFNEENMINIVRNIDGDDAAVHLATDHSHPTHGHDEIGLAFVRVKNGVVFKDRVIQETDTQMFYHNTRYAMHIVEALARTPKELGKGIIIADQLPIAGVSALGRGQHIGEITGTMLAA